MNKPFIIIIGAGATGLIAAKELSPYFKVIVLEAQPFTGGRLQSILQQGNTIESGAEFIHGNLPVTMGLLKEAGIDYVKTTGEMHRKKNGRLTRVQEMMPGWDRLLEKMKAVTIDMTMQELLEKYYSGPGDELLCKQVRAYAEGFDLADITKVSVKALYREWDADDYVNYRIPAGYSALVQYLQQEAESRGAVFYTNIPVKQVHWQEGSVTMIASNGEKFTACKLLVTVPVSVLQQPDSKAFIRFSPSLHFDENTSGDIGFGAVIKVVFKFKKIYWPPDTGFILSDELFPTWWTQLPDKIPVLTGWLGGPGAIAISNETDESIAEKALSSLASIFDKPISTLKKELEQSMVFNWQKNDYTMGGYSYATLDSESAIKIITTPLADTIFFAGEALYTGHHPGTVEAALQSGMDAVMAIKDTGLC